MEGLQAIKLPSLQFGQRALSVKTNDIVDWLERFGWGTTYHTKSDRHHDRFEFAHRRFTGPKAKVPATRLPIPNVHGNKAETNTPFMQEVAQNLGVQLHTLATAVQKGLSLGKAKRLVGEGAKGAKRKRSPAYATN